MNKLLLTFCLLLFGTLSIVAQTSLEGKVKDKGVRRAYPVRYRCTVQKWCAVDRSGNRSGWKLFLFRHPARYL